MSNVDYVERPRRFRHATWDGTNPADCAAVAAGSQPDSGGWSYTLLSGDRVKVSMDAYPDVIYHTLELGMTLVAGPYFGTFGTNACEIRTLNPGRFELEFEPAP